jgi:spermidine/putrescine transport system ATP-binding protein
VSASVRIAAIDSWPAAHPAAAGNCDKILGLPASQPTRSVVYPMALLEVRNVTRRFGDFTAVDGVSLTIEAGEFFTLLGPSGCGKTTLLRMIAGFELPDDGSILLDGRDLVDHPPEARPVRTVFQSYALFPHMTVEGNVAFPLKMARTPATEIGPRVAAALEDVRLQGFGKRFPHELSGGQKQRVAIARALAGGAPILLADEPTANLDSHVGGQVLELFRDLAKRDGRALLVVTHDPKVRTIADRVERIHDGRLVPEGVLS